MNFDEHASESGEDPYTLNPDTIAGYLEETGRFASFFERYEERPPQLALVRTITACFNTGSIGIFEAGTGVGKSLAYLLPALVWAQRNRKRIVISTGTINLQHQLIEKDVPTALKILNSNTEEPQAVLIKGRQNYLCLRRLMQAVQEPDLFSQEQQSLADIQNWARTAKEGSRAELPFFPAPALWAKVCSESDNCLAQRCPYYSSCFVMKVKKQAEKAALLIVNHHLLFADLASRREGAGYEGAAVLPAFAGIIFDEAHTIEDSATHFFSHNFSRFELNRSITALTRIKKGRDYGCLGKIAAVSSSADLLPVSLAGLAELQAHFSALEAAAAEFCAKAAQLSFTQALPKNTQLVLKSIRGFYSVLQKTQGNLAKIIGNADADPSTEEAVREGSAAFKRLQEILDTAEAFLRWQELPDFVFWVEVSGSGSKAVPYFHQTPIDMAPILRKSVFNPFETVICTSATLKIGKSFSFWLARIGLLHETGRVVTGSFDSPFPYHTNVLLNVPTDVPLPDDTAFQPFINEAITRLIEITGGRTLVLFTSYESLKQACAYARGKLPEMELLQQGEADRSKLLQRFKENIESSLFATASFWAGIDVPGEALTHVVLVKLPFAVPSDPIFRARADGIERQGGSSFMQLSVPSAVVQFRQGFGRLMRSHTDGGMVTVLDKRILVKQYGKIFIDSIPKTRQSFAPLNEIVYTIENFLY